MIRAMAAVFRLIPIRPFFNASNLELIGYYIQEGSYNDVRLMSDGYLYIISSDDKYLDYEETSDDDIDNYIPQ